MDEHSRAISQQAGDLLILLLALLCGAQGEDFPLPRDTGGSSTGGGTRILRVGHWLQEWVPGWPFALFYFVFRVWLWVCFFILAKGFSFLFLLLTFKRMQIPLGLWFEFQGSLLSFLVDLRVYANFPYSRVYVDLFLLLFFFVGERVYFLVLRQSITESFCFPLSKREWESILVSGPCSLPFLK